MIAKVPLKRASTAEDVAALVCFLATPQSGNMTGEGVRIFIGAENKLFSLSGSSMVAAPFHDANQRIIGVLGIIGPTRLNYARVVPMVDYTARVISQMIGSM